MSTNPDTGLTPPTIACSVLLSGTDKIVLRLEIRNDGEATIHLFDSPRMPYLIRQDDNSLLVLYGVNPPDPNVLYYGIEIPTTQPLNPGQTIELTMDLVQLLLDNHYQFGPEETTIRGDITVYCQVGWGHTPITQEIDWKLSITALLAWQHIVTTEPLHITLP